MTYMDFLEWFWLAMIIAWIPRTIYRTTKLQRAMRADGLSTDVNLTPLFKLFTWKRQLRRAQWEYIREQEEHRDSDKRLRPLGNGGSYVSDRMDFVRFSGPAERGQ